MTSEPGGGLKSSLPEVRLHRASMFGSRVFVLHYCYKRIQNTITALLHRVTFPRRQKLQSSSTSRSSIHNSQLIPRKNFTDINARITFRFEIFVTPSTPPMMYAEAS